MPSFYELLKYAKTGVASPDMTAYDKLRALAMAGGAKYPVRTITGVPPLSFRSDGRPLISWSMLGNTQQTGTPSPDNIIMPEFVGVRTANLFDKSTAILGKRVVVSGTSDNPSYACSDYIPITGIASLRVSDKTTATNFYFYSTKSDVADSYQDAAVATVPPTANYVRVNIPIDKVDTFMLNTGDTALPYEPYGWAEKITSAGQTTPVYLGQVPTTRRVRKLVLTGKEEWAGSAKFRIVLAGQIGTIAPICTHYRGVTTAAYGDLADGCVTVNGGVGLTLTIYDTVNQSSLTAWKSYLAAQYAAGTPVTVWYVLATPETGITNEPLAKIGDYADELHSEDAGITIPTVKGENTLTVETELQPSSVSITGHITPV